MGLGYWRTHPQPGAADQSCWFGTQCGLGRRGRKAPEGACTHIGVWCSHTAALCEWILKAKNGGGGAGGSSLLLLAHMKRNSCLARGPEMGGTGEGQAPSCPQNQLLAGFHLKIKAPGSGACSSGAVSRGVFGNKPIGLCY